ncbi:MAG: exopolysaccharide biosynthesis polyprenyl glycosylphosphotransferase, partial [Nanoarchaeota archaeon]|nr:exopolysaccharide biosynthesis polyprenyl glycosylphosphotransferase [Nanoarchaeota archaeon]
EKIKASPELGYKIIGTITNGQKLDLKKLSAIIQKKGVAVVFLPSNFKKKQELYELIFNNPNTRFNIIPDIMEIVSEKISFEEFKDVPIMTIKEEAGFQLYSLIKTIADRMFAAFLIIILSLFLIIFAGLIKLTSKGPVFYCHTRLGKNLNHFKLYKFRTMVPKASSIKVRLMKRNHSKYLFKMKNDPRITPVGKCLRRFCLDELPQLINILKGEMSFVGPRPHLPSELREFKGWKKKRFTIKPGLTGLWQVSGRHDLNFDRSVSLDLYYIKNLSFILDIKILLKTIPAILFSKGKW